MSANLIPFPPLGAEEHASAETQRKAALFAWADAVLQEIGLAERIARASSHEELGKIVFDPDDTQVALAIREALHPMSGTKADHFAGLREGGLKRILRSRFDEMKEQREPQLRRGQGGSQQSASSWTDELILDTKGGVRPVLSNFILFLRHHPQWQGVLGFDLFASRVLIHKCPPWGPEAPDAPWTDHHESCCRVWFQNEDIIKAGQDDIGRAVQAAARANPFHPVVEFLDALHWDETPRLDTWLITYFHAQDSPYVRAIGPRYLISAVARIFEPGCKADHTLILEGTQGRQKSEALRTLAMRDDWFSDRLSNVGSKDAAIEIAGVWLIEISEMDALMRATSSAVKSFLTRRFDRFRPPWARHLVRLQRQCVFSATINPPLVGGYLKDASGLRRFWPVTCRGMIDRDGLERDRAQLWAEAVHRYRAGEKWWLETPELEALASVEQSKRLKTDAWTPLIKQWLGRRTDVAIAEVLRGALAIKRRHQSHSAEIRVAKILAELGFEQYLSRKGTKRQRRYRKHQP
jgi:hypothetical protein